MRFDKAEISRALNGETDGRTAVHKTLKGLWEKHQKKIDENNKKNALQKIDDINKKNAFQFRTITRIPWPKCFEEEYRERVLQAPHTGKRAPNTLEILDPWETDGKPWMPEYVRNIESYKRYTMREAWDHLVRQHGIQKVAKQWQEQFNFVLLPIKQLENEPNRFSKPLHKRILANLKQWEQDNKK